MLYIMILLILVISILPLILSSSLLAKVIHNGWDLWLKAEIFDLDEIYSSD